MGKPQGPTGSQRGQQSPGKAASLPGSARAGAAPAWPAPSGGHLGSPCPRASDPTHHNCPHTTWRNDGPTAPASTTSARGPCPGEACVWHLMTHGREQDRQGRGTHSPRSSRRQPRPQSTGGQQMLPTSAAVILCNARVDMEAIPEDSEPCGGDTVSTPRKAAVTIKSGRNSRTPSASGEK